MRLADAVADLLADEKTRLKELGRDIARGSNERLRDANRRLATAGRELASQTTLRLSHERGQLQKTAMRLTHSSLRMCERKATALQQAETRRRLLDPTRVLQRGFAIVRTEDGRIAPSVNRLTNSQDLRVQFRDGSASVQVNSVEPNES